MSDLTWTPDTARLDSLELWERNPKTMSKRRAERLLQSWRDMNQYQTLAVGPAGECYDGHQRIQALRAAGYDGGYTIAVMRSSRALTDEERRRLVIESTVGTVGALDWDELAAWPAAELQGYGLDAEALAEWNDAGANLALMLEGGIEPQDYSDLDAELGDLEGYEETDIKITVPIMHKTEVEEWLANGEMRTAPGMGKGVLKRCGLL